MYIFCYIILHYDYSTAGYVYVMDWGCEEMFDKIVGSGVENNTNFADYVYIAPNRHNYELITLLQVIEQHFYNL